MILAGLSHSAFGQGAQENNDLFDNEESRELLLDGLSVAGEVRGGGAVDLSDLPLRTCLVKEMLWDSHGGEFRGAYRYEGYSLHDIVAAFPLDKSNAKEFRPVMDAYIEVENADGIKTVFSWGEVFFPAQLHRILIASRVAPVLPEMGGEKHELSEHSKLVVAGDLYSERNLSRPVKITVRSHPVSPLTEKGKSPLYSPDITLHLKDGKEEKLAAIPKIWQEHVLPGIFYGKGMGYHGSEPMEGTYLKEWLLYAIPPDKEAIRQGLFAIVGDDGYRASFSYSEICNRNDHSELLLKQLPEGEDDGLFRIYVPGDFFIDRSVRAISDIWYSE